MTIIINTKQLNPKDSYVGGPCERGKCRVGTDAEPRRDCQEGDAAYNLRRCGLGPFNNAPLCNAQFECTKLDTSVCPIIGGVQPSVKWDPSVSVRDYSRWKDPTYLNVQCTYPTSTVKNAQDLSNFKSNFSNNPNLEQVIDRDVLPTFCSVPSTSCSEGVSSCSRFHSTDEEGKICRAWDKRDHGAADVAKTTYCKNNPSSLECRCINRASDKIYQAIAAKSNSPDACWFLPCKNPDTYLVPSTISLSTTCPNICQQINDFTSTDGANISIGELKQSIDCNFTQTVTDEGVKTIEVSPPTPTKSNTSLLIIISIAILLIIISIVIYFIYR